MRFSLLALLGLTLCASLAQAQSPPMTDYEWRRYVEERLNHNDRKIDVVNRKADSALAQLDDIERKVNSTLKRLESVDNKTDRALDMLSRIQTKIDTTPTPSVTYVLPPTVSQSVTYASQAVYVPSSVNYGAPPMSYAATVTYGAPAYAGTVMYSGSGAMYPGRWILGSPVRAVAAGFGPAWNRPRD